MCKQSKVHHSTVTKIICQWKTFKSSASLPSSGCPSKFISRSDCPMLRGTAKNPRATAQTLQHSISTSNIKVHDSTMRSLKWPPQSSDLSPISHLRDVLGREICTVQICSNCVQDFCRMFPAPC